MQNFLSFLMVMICAGNISNAQNVGIGTPAPSEKLQVAGNIKADTLKPNVIKITANAGAGKLLTSDDAGNASWQSLKASDGVTSNGTVGFGSWGDCSMNGISEYNPVTDTAASVNDAFGFSVAESGQFALVGVPGNNHFAGYADVYQFNGNNWVLIQKLTDPGSAAGDLFGCSVAISGNFVIVGAAADTVGGNPSQGSACIFQYNGTKWEFMQKLTDPGGSAGDFFGVSVSISGNNAIAGAALDDIGAQADQGSASIFHFNGTSWDFVQKLTQPGGNAGDRFASVCISDNSAIVGASFGLVGTNARQGYAGIFKFNGSSWVFVQKLTDPTGAAGDGFGASVAISGNFAVAGATGVDAGAITDQGAVLTFSFDGSNWVFMQKLTDPTAGIQNFFGSCTSISGNYLIVGSPNHGAGTNIPGSAMIFSRVGLQWQQLQNISDPQGHPNDGFGSGVSIDGTTHRFLIGASGYASSSGKAVFGRF